MFPATTTTMSTWEPPCLLSSAGTLVSSIFLHSWQLPGVSWSPRGNCSHSSWLGVPIPQQTDPQHSSALGTLWQSVWGTPSTSTIAVQLHVTWGLLATSFIGVLMAKCTSASEEHAMLPGQRENYRKVEGAVWIIMNMSNLQRHHRIAPLSTVPPGPAGSSQSYTDSVYTSWRNSIKCLLFFWHINVLCLPRIFFHNLFFTSNKKIIILLKHYI